MGETAPIPVYAIVGSETFLADRAVMDIASTMPPDTQRLTYDGEDCSAPDVLDELRSYSMFGGYKLVTIRSADDFVSRYRAELESYVAKPSDAGTLLLRMSSLPKTQKIAKLIEKNGQIITCTPPDKGRLPAWITDRAKAHRVGIEPEAARRLADLIGVDLGRIDAELQRLALSGDGKMIRSDDVSATVAFQREQEMWEMTDALSMGRIDEAVRRWRQLVAGDPSSEFRAVTWLSLWIEKAQRALAMKRQRVPMQTIATTLRIYPAANVEKLLVSVERMGDVGLDRAMHRLVEVDRANKTNLGDPDVNIERFLLSMRV